MTIPTKLSDWNSSARILRAVRALVDNRIDRTVPKDRIAKLISFSRVSGQAFVQFPGDTGSTPVQMSNQVQPTVNWAFGDMVRVRGEGTSAFIVDIVGAEKTAMIVGPELATPTLVGDNGIDRLGRYIYAQELTTYPVHSVYHLGRWQNSEFNTQLTGFLDIVVLEKQASASVIKKYNIPLRQNATSGYWVKVLPACKTMSLQGDDFGLEILVDTTGFELRIRNILNLSGTGNILRELHGWCYGTPFSFMEGSSSGVSAPPSCTDVYLSQGTVAITNPTSGLPTYTYAAPGSLGSPEMSAMWRANISVTGGGNLQSGDGNGPVYDGVFVVNGLGISELFPNGKAVIPVIPAGTVVPVVTSTTGATVTASANGKIQLQASQSLYYELPIGDDGTTLGSYFPLTLGNSANFRIVDGGNSVDTFMPFMVPPHWIRVATNLDLVGGPSPSAYPTIRWANGRETARWFEVAGTFSNGWVDYLPGSYETAAYKKENGRVYVRGLVKNGTIGAVGFNLGVGYRPPVRLLFPGICATSNISRIEVLANGDFYPLYLTSGGTNAYASINCNFAVEE
jgi:hypothetical protein